MTTSTPVKTTGTSLLALQSISANGNVVGSSLNVSTYFGGIVFIHFGRTTTSAPTTGVSFRVEVAATSSTGAGEWFPLTTVITGITAANGSNNSSSTGATITLVSGTGFAAQQIILIADGTLAHTEWARVVSVSTNVLTLEETLQFSHTTGTTYNQAEMYAIPLDLSAAGQLRVVADGSAHNQAFLCEAYVDLFTSVTNV